MEAGLAVGTAAGALCILISTLPAAAPVLAAAPWLTAAAALGTAACGLGAALLACRAGRRLGRLEQALRRALADDPFLFPDRDGGIGAIAAAVEELLSARDTARRAWRDHEQRWRDIAEAASEWIWESDADHRFTSFAAPPGTAGDLDPRQLLGRRPAEVVERTAGEEEGWRRHEEGLREGQPFRDVCYRLRGTGGQLHCLRVSGKPIFDEDGAFAGYRGVALEITAEVESEQRAAEARRLMMEALRQARDAAEQANQSKSRFLAAASHDLRQPLQALGLFVATLAQRPLADDMRHIVDRIEGSLEALEHLLDTLLDISRLDAGVVEAHLANFPIQNLFDRLSRDFVPLAEDKGLSIRFVPSRAVLRSDSALLERILRNLLSNAVRYTDRGGIVIGLRRSGGLPRIEVWDSGRGIPPDHLGEIFREFHQVGGAQSGRRQGLGLGLAIVDRLASLLNHRISVRSTPGRGSVFAVAVSGHSGPPALPDARPAALVARNPLAGRTILVVDDNSIVRDGMQAVLEVWGCRVFVAAGRAEAEVLVCDAASTPEAIIADYRLSGAENGMEVVESLRKSCGRKVPAVLITGDTSPERLRQATAQGLPLLQKPVRPDTLREALQQIFAKSAGVC